MSHRSTWAVLGFSLLAWTALGVASPDDPKPTPTPPPTPTPTPPPTPTPTPKPSDEKKPDAKKPDGKQPPRRGRRRRAPKPDAKKPDAKKPDAKKKKAPEKWERKVTPGPTTLIENVRLEGVAGTVSVVLSGGKISAIARQIPPRARQQLKIQRTIDAKGGRLGPGRIDAWASVGDAVANGHVTDAYDPYDRDTVEAALSQGITTAYLNPMRGPAIGGQGAVIKLIPGGELEEVLVKKGLALHAGLGLSGTTLATSLQDYEALSKYLEQVRNYQDSWIEYEEKLEKYEKELAAFAKTQAAAKAPAGGPAKRPVRRPTRPTPPSKGAPSKGAPSKGPTRPTPPSKGAPAAPAGKTPPKKKAPTRPTQPPINRAYAEAGKLLDGELPLRLEAHRVEDIVNALELSQTYGFELILEGATEAHLLTDVLVKRKVKVVLGAPLMGEDKNAYPLRRVPDLAARLEAAGIAVVIGSDGWAKSGSLAETSAQHVQDGLSPAAAEAAVTTRAAALLGLETVGKLERGHEADLVLYSADAFGAEAVELVFVDGRIVYQRRAP